MSSFESAISSHDPPDRLTLGPAALRLKGLGLAVGVVCMAVAIVWGLAIGDDMRRFFHSYLLAFTYFLSIALGALFFVVIHHLVAATWSVVLRRLAEIITGAFPALFVLMLGLVLPILAGSHSLFLWTDSDVVAHDHVLLAKQGYLNAPFFAIRMLIYFAVWMWMSRYFMKRSVQQDETGDVVVSARLRRVAGPATIAYALTTAWAGFDLLGRLLALQDAGGRPLVRTGRVVWCGRHRERLTHGVECTGPNGHEPGSATRFAGVGGQRHPRQRPCQDGFDANVSR